METIDEIEPTTPAPPPVPTPAPQIIELDEDGHCRVCNWRHTDRLHAAVLRVKGWRKTQVLYWLGLVDRTHRTTKGGEPTANSMMTIVPGSTPPPAQAKPKKERKRRRDISTPIY